MRIVFGWNSFKVRSFTLSDLGIMKQTEPGLQFEVRQAYFHLFWIPFFGLGKRWIVRKGNGMYEMPLEIQTLAKSTLTGVRTPWYTFAGPLILAGVGLYFTVVTAWQDRQSHIASVDNYKEQATALSGKLQHLTTNDFITLGETNDYYNLYLKVEDIKGDDIMVTPVESKSEAPMRVEREYTKHAATLPSVKISYKKLLAAFPKEYDSSVGYARSRQAAHLLNDDKVFIVKDVVRHFRPIVKVSYANFYNSGIAIRCSNEGWPATITEMKNVVGNIDWSEIINEEFPNEQGSYNSLKGKNIKYGEPYKFIMTLKDSIGHFYKYEIGGDGRYKVAMHEL